MSGLGLMAMQNACEPYYHQSMKLLIKILIAILVLLVAGDQFLRWRSHQAESASIVWPRPTLQTRHYDIHSTADAQKTQRVANAVESLHTAYREFFSRADRLPPHPLRLKLYRDQAEFKAHNLSAPWAEAYYLTPTCHAYYADGTANPYHWMLHEAVHQLNREVSGFTRHRWSDEGLAAYFATSTLRDGRLSLGELDRNAYPLWWLPELRLSGNREKDIASGALIPLRQLLDDSGPPIAKNVNLYYMEYWSLVHYLLEGDEGRHAEAFKALLADDATLANFEKRIGPIDAVEAQWYAHLRQLAFESRMKTPDSNAVPVEIGE